MRRLDRSNRLDIVAAQQHGVLERTTVSATEAGHAAWTIIETGDGIVTKVGGARAAGLALSIGRNSSWPLLPWRTPLRLVGAPWIADRLYEFVARNRHRLPGDTPWCEQHRHDCRPLETD